MKISRKATPGKLLDSFNVGKTGVGMGANQSKKQRDQKVEMVRSWSPRPLEKREGLKIGLVTNG